MGSIDIVKPLSSVLGSAVNKSRHNQEKNYLTHRESNPDLLGEKMSCLCYAALLTHTSLVHIFMNC